MLVRRDVLTQRDNRTVKWALVAAAFALSLGSFAEHTLAKHGDETTTTATVQQPAPVAPTAIAG